MDSEWRREENSKKKVLIINEASQKEIRNKPSGWKLSHVKGERMEVACWVLSPLNGNELRW